MAGIPVDGSNAQGKAGVFGGSVNPLAVYMQYQAGRQRRQDLIDAEDRKRRDEGLDYLNKYLPETKFNEFNYRLNDVAQKAVRDPFMTSRLQGKPLHQSINEAERNKGMVNALREEYDGWKSTISDMEGKINQGIKEGYIEPHTLSRLHDVYLDPKGALKSDEDVRHGVHTIEQLLLNPENINKEGAITNWVNNLKDQGRAMYSTTLNDGYTPDQVENIVTSKLKYERNQDGTLKSDSNGNPIPIIDENTYRLARMNMPLRIKMDAEGGPTDQTKMQWLSKNIPGGIDSIKENRQIHSGHKLDDEKNPRNFAFGINFGMPVEEIKNRREWLQMLTSGDHPELTANISNTITDTKAEYVYPKEVSTLGKIVGIKGEGDSKKPIAIKITYPTSIESDDPNYKPNSGTIFTNGKRTLTREIPIRTPEERERAEILINEIKDKQLSLAGQGKKAIGTDAYFKYNQALKGKTDSKAKKWNGDPNNPL